MNKLQPGGLTAEALIKRHGIALRWERNDPDNPRNGAWVAAFHFAGPDVVQQGATPEAAMENFIVAVTALQDGLISETQS